MFYSNAGRPLWASALGLDVSDINDNDNFFDLGGDSVQAIRLAEVARARHLKLDVETVFNYPDFQDMLTNTETVTITDSPSEARSQGQLDTATVRACADTCGVGLELIEDIFPTTTLQSALLQDHIQVLGCSSLSSNSEVHETRRWCVKLLTLFMLEIGSDALDLSSWTMRWSKSC